MIPAGTEFFVAPSGPEDVGALTFTYNNGTIELRNASSTTLSANSEVTAVVRRPNITLTGKATFDGAFFDVPYNNVIGSGQGPVTLTGHLSYDIYVTDSTLSRSCGIHVALSGSYSYDYPSILQLELPSSFVFTSQIIVLLCLVSVLVVFALFVLYCSSLTEENSKSKLARMIRRLKSIKIKLRYNSQNG